MSFDEKLFSWLYRKLPQREDKNSYLVNIDWAPILGVVASSIFNREVEVHIADEPMSFDHHKLVLSQRHPNVLRPDQVRKLFFYQMYFFKTLEYQNIQTLGAEKMPSIHQMILADKPIFGSLFLELDSQFYWLGKALQGEPIEPKSYFYIWPEGFVKSSKEKIDTTETYAERTDQQKKSIEAAAKKRPKKVKITEQKENPLLHVFEKVITIESFHGGDRPVEDADDLMADEQALQEIKLDTLIRTKDQASGLVKSDILMDSEVIEDDNDITPFEGRVISYPEWFYRENKYHQDWVKVHLAFPQPKLTGTKLNDKIDLQLAFESPLWLRACKSGSEFDLPQVIDWFSTPIEQRDDKQKFYSEKRHLQEDTAFLFLLDQSLSTDTWMGQTQVFQLLKENLKKIAPTFADAEWPFAVASFSSQTRHQVQYSILKDFEQSLSQLSANLDELIPSGYTRIGPALRHSNEILLKRSESKKYLVLLSDCKPTDFDAYEGEHGYHDVLKAIEELRANNIEVLVYSAQQDQNSWLRNRLKNAHFFSFKNTQEWLDQFFEIICLRR